MLKYFNQVIILLLILTPLSSVLADEQTKGAMPLKENSNIKDPLNKLKQKEEIFISRIAVVDISAILENSIAVKSIKESVTTISKQIQEELSEKELLLKKEEEELTKIKGKISENEYNERLFNFNQKVSKAQYEQQKKKLSLEQSRAAAIAEVHNNTIEVINQLSNKYKFNVVLPSTQVLFVNKDLNITLEVITLLNQKLKKVDVNYSPIIED